MRKSRQGTFRLTAACFGCLLAYAAAAEEFSWFGEKAPGQWMLGIKGGIVDSGAESGFDETAGYGALLGYQFARPIAYNGKAAIEFEVWGTDDGDIDANNSIGGTGTWDADIVSLFFAYRTPGDVYFKAKLGGVYSDVTARVGGEKFDGDDIGLGYGAGLGIRFGKERERVQIELELVGSTGDNDISGANLGANLLF